MAESLSIEGFEIEVSETQPVVIKEKIKVEAEPKVRPEEKERFNALLPKSLLEKARDIAFWTPQMSLTQLVEEGLRIRIAQIEEQNGGEYKKREGPLKVGRRAKAR